MKRDINLPRILKTATVKSDVKASNEPTPRIIAITSGKGGVGKTSLSVNLGLALTALGQRVIILDADLGMANAEILTGVSPPYTLYDCLYQGRNISEIICPVPGGMQLISGGSGILKLTHLDEVVHQRLMESLQVLNSLADFILVDTGAGISKNVITFLAAAEEVIVVVVPEPTSLADAYVLIKVLAKYDLHREVNLVVNKARSHADAEQTANKIKVVTGRFLEMKVNYLGFILEDRIVNESVRRQEPFVLYNRQSVPTLSVISIARTLLGEITDETVKPRGGIAGFAGRLVQLLKLR